MTNMLARIVAQSAAGLALWERWSHEIFRDLPPWAKQISSAKIIVRVVLVVPDEVVHERVLVMNHADGTVERRLVHERQLVVGRDSGGWVDRGVIGASPHTDEGRARIAELRELERLGLVERDGRLWWRPTASGREAARQMGGAA